MQWLVDQAMPGDSLFLHFSGHGYQVKDISGDELDGYDEAILPCDFETEGYILDDVLYDILVRPLKEGVRLTVVFDSCHSGTALDLPYIHLPTGELQHTFLNKEPKGFLSRFKMMNFRSTLTLAAKNNKDVSGAMFLNIFKYFRIKKHIRRNQKNFTSKAEVIMFSACQDFQTSADTIIQGQARGVMTWALLEALGDPNVITYADILLYTQSILSKKYNQSPQLSSGKLIDMYSPFIL
ncbi:Ca(2+)-dependent cysteine protease [Coelomomyces lativittatus]|nr:Ca(2+)-dependent cysteine protease [Coelomomyces lativittatus]